MNSYFWIDDKYYKVLGLEETLANHFKYRVNCLWSIDGKRGEEHVYWPIDRTFNANGRGFIRYHSFGVGRDINWYMLFNLEDVVHQISKDDYWTGPGGIVGEVLSISDYTSYKVAIKTLGGVEEWDWANFLRNWKKKENNNLVDRTYSCGFEGETGGPSGFRWL